MSPNSLKICGIRLAGYRSFGHPVQFIGPFEKVNLFVGQNNSGKSNILRYLHNHYLRWSKHGKRPENNLDPEVYEHHGRANTEPIYLEIGFPIDAPPLRDHFASGRGTFIKDALVATDPILYHEGLVFAPFSNDVKDRPALLDLKVEELMNSYRLVPQLKTLAMNWSPGARSVDPTAIIKACISEIIALYQTIQTPPIYLIPQFRQIRATETSHGFDFPTSLDGAHAIDQLARLQNPGHDTIASTELAAARTKFQKIKAFFQSVVEAPDATIEASYDRKTIIVDMKGRTATLESLGAGLHQLMILAIITTYYDGVIFCVEEPEVHMHPTLQKRLLHYLATQTNNQYFITTHSASLIDIDEPIAVFHVVHDDVQSYVSRVLAPQGRRLITDDLGIRPSDLVQANCLLWVEGPSDRIYLNKLIQSLSGDLLKENVHYAFALYGGDVRANLTLDDDLEAVVNDVISILPINRNAIMIADSDKTAPDEQQKNPHKIRLKEAFENANLNGFYWETQGREIENYIKNDVLAKARSTVHPRSRFLEIDSKFADTMAIQGGDGYDARKVKIAKLVAAENTPFDPETDVLDKGKLVVEKIKAWNGLR